MIEELKKILEGRPKLRIKDVNRVPAAVLIPVYQKHDRYYIIFIRRTETVKDHKGQISFPGGARNTDDRTLLYTALRESREEIGLGTKDIDVIGEMDDEITTTTNYIVTPFVAIVPWPYRFRKNKDEVAQIIQAPIAALLKKDQRQDEQEIWNDQPIESYVYEYRGQVIWGATARILKKLLDIIEQIQLEQKSNNG